MWNDLPLKIEPIIFSFGWLDLRWYSLGYFLAVLTLWQLVNYRLKKKEVSFPISQNQLKKIFLFSFLGMFLGAKIGYLLFYGWTEFLSSPWQSISPFAQGKFIGFFGLSFHGGLVGGLLGGILGAHQEKLSFFQLTDLIFPALPLAYFWGRLGNFFNGELFGRITQQPWGMFFPADPNHLRHPSQLYEACGEGLLLFLILWPIRNQPTLQKKFLFLYLIFYGLIRFFLEFFRQAPLFFFNSLTIGQILCLIMIFVGWLGIYSKKLLVLNKT